jgi:phage head maturation protease
MSVAARFTEFKSRSASVRASSWNPEDRTIEVVFLDSESIVRKNWDGTTFREVLPMAVGRFDRFKGAASMFVEHYASARNAVGVIQDWWQDDSEGRPRGLCRIRLTDAPGDVDVVHKIIDGTLPTVSVGYDPDGWSQEVVDGVTVRTATGWDALEVSSVGVPADPGAHVRGRGARAMDDAAKFMAAIVILAGDDKPLSKVYKEVAKAAGCTPEDVKAFAEGTAEPDPEQLGPLAAALGLPVKLGDAPAEPAAADETTPDADAGTDSEPTPADPPAEEEPPMANAQDVAAETERATKIADLAIKHGRSKDLPAWLADPKMTTDRVRTAILDAQAAEDDGAGIHGRHAADIRITRDEGDTVRASFEASIWMKTRRMSPVAASRMVLGVEDGAPSDHKVQAVAAGVEKFSDRRVIEACRILFARTGMTGIDDLTDREIAKLALGGTVSRMGRATLVAADVANLLTNTANKSMLKAIGDYSAIYKQIAAYSPTSDFRPKRPVMLSSWPALKEIPEAGNVEPGVLSDKIESYTPKRRGRMLSLVVEMMQNDDLNGLVTLPGTAGRRIERDRDAVLITLLNNAFGTTTLADGVALVHATHRNIGTTPGAPSAALLDEALEIMGLQQNIDGDPETIIPTMAVVPVAHQGAMLRLVESTYGPTTAATGQLAWIRGLKVIANGLLDSATYGGNSNRWFLFADPSDWPAFEWTEVSGNGPRVESQYDFASDALQMKATHSFGAGAVDQRGIFGNAGV